LKNHRTWIIAAIVFQLLTGLIHGISLFSPVQATQESEKTLVELFTTQKLDFGAGFHRTLYEMFQAVSVCLSLLFLFGGILNWYLLRKKASTEIVSGILTLEVVIFGICFATTTMFAFLPPIIFTGLCFLMLLLARITMPKTVPYPIEA
jgi:hypothetical protein